MAEYSIGEVEVPYVSFVDGDAGMESEMRSTIAERPPIPRQDHGARPETEVVNGMKEGLGHPATKEPRATRHQKPGSPELIPEITRVLQHVVQIGGRQRRTATPRHRSGCPPRTRLGRGAGPSSPRASRAVHSDRTAGDRWSR